MLFIVGLRKKILAALVFTVFFHCGASWGSDELFGVSGTESSDLSMFPKWESMLSRFGSEVGQGRRACPKGMGFCKKKEWAGLLDSLAGNDKKSQIKSVNGFINAFAYVTDIVNWGVEDYWATPYQFFIKDGDCEDYAIAKYFSLKALGFSGDSMKIVVLNDKNLRMLHSVLAVSYEGRNYILDNQSSAVITDDSIRHYRPIFAVGENAWWRYRVEK